MGIHSANSTPNSSGIYSHIPRHGMLVNTGEHCCYARHPTELFGEFPHLQFCEVATCTVIYIGQKGSKTRDAEWPATAQTGSGRARFKPKLTFWAHLRPIPTYKTALRSREGGCGHGKPVLCLGLFSRMHSCPESASSSTTQAVGSWC